MYLFKDIRKIFDQRLSFFTYVEVTSLWKKVINSYNFLIQNEALKNVFTSHFYWYYKHIFFKEFNFPLFPRFVLMRRITHLFIFILYLFRFTYIPVALWFILAYKGLFGYYGLTTNFPRLNFSILHHDFDLKTRIVVEFSVQFTNFYILQNWVSNSQIFIY